MKRISLFIFVVLILAEFSGCAPKLVYPPDQAALDACSRDCLEQWKSCRGQGCDADRASCVQHCRDYGGLRGGGKVTLEVPGLGK